MAEFIGSTYSRYASLDARICPSVERACGPHSPPGIEEGSRGTQRNERSFMMMDGWAGGGMWVWTVIGVVVVVLLVVVISKLSRK